MRLKQVVREGKFCGLETVEECILNWELHAMQMYPYNALEYETKELIKDIKAYEDGILTLDMEEIDRMVAEDLHEFDLWCREMETPEDELDKQLEILRW
jgi:hypothetical protein